MSWVVVACWLGRAERAVRRVSGLFFTFMTASLFAICGINAWCRLLGWEPAAGDSSLLGLFAMCWAWSALRREGRS